ncbi:MULTISPECIES: efflux RND transporter permease subunit [Caballeronia]|jgi:multidrug efflux pump|uniref:efflux RND transporter permease subunit n=1 Tax=Caballeronia TaxID=1827195 RepID=UPI00025BB5C6|nr:MULTISPECIES: efflux RND transporter permease subunit [Caballeronia]EKS71534.1 hydrophobe/amphiphile efflux-1 (HAE1) family transporter [Burkholderia sp. SJ98]MCG7403328.1 multidrug efflux RND transporter permease subunit [Caballeronia zhejiangensis]MCI1044860.1 multidrug efflux RND transporter permease subunit [Caballeronia zhejiangensis]MDR5769556.1 efflux RND transporter permease subunit [Caballeronia sp. LZ028]MDR5790535.1 efflux RND transporter permease subunit [Caballeronia sp. LP003]
MLSRFFIHRPVLAWVIAIVVMLIGALSIRTLSVEQYPNVAPPSIRITATYPGASADTLATTVTQVIEQDMTGIDNLMYMSSTSSSAGTATITLTFKSGTNADVAAMQVQNKVQEANASLPSAVQQQGIQVSKTAGNILMVVSVTSTDGRMNTVDLGNLLATRVQDPLTQISGVGQVTLFSAQHSMRVWLDPVKLRSVGLMPSDVTTAIDSQNAQLSVGQIGGAPQTKTQAINATIVTRGFLKTSDEFANILLRVNQDGSRVYLKDVGTVEVGGDSYDMTSRLNGKPAAAMGIMLASGANALSVAKAVRAQLAVLQKQMPGGVQLSVPHDTTPFVSASISEVITTLFEAVVLVFLVMYLFLGNLRATLIPTIVVPVALLGTFALIAAVGFTINVLSLFALVLAIGLLVDDAIVVVENVERLLSEGLSPLDATIKAMGEIGGALIGVTAVLTAVFIPMAFMSGSTGEIYRQFSLTITSAMVLSVLLALTLTPALCATLLRPVDPQHQRRGFFAWFERTFEGGTRRYERVVTRLVARPLRWMAAYAAICGVAALLYWQLPSSFLPDEDQGTLMTIVNLPAGSSSVQANVVEKQVESYFTALPEVENVVMLDGFSVSGSGQNMAMAMVKLKDWKDRKGKGQSAAEIVGAANAHFRSLRAGQVFVMNPPAVQGLGSYSGVDFELKDMAGLGHDQLVAARNKLLALAAKDPKITGMRPAGMADVPQYAVDIDYLKASALGVSASNINDTLQTAFGSTYVNNYVDTGRIQKVYVQALPQYRMMPADIGKWFVTSSNTTTSTTSYDGKMVPFSSFASGHWTTGSPQVERYNRSLSMEMTAQSPQGVSSGDTMNAIEALVAQLPQGIAMEWTGQSYQEKLAGSQATYLYALSLIVVFLCLAGLYESWSVPFSVILVVPLGIVGALVAAHLRGFTDDIYFKVGLLTTIGLATKNAILIVEYAKSLHERGHSVRQAAIEAAHLRLRPIVMTSLAFGFGVLPMAFASGAGASSRESLGNGVLGGVIAATLLAIVFVPVFFVLIRGFGNRKKEGAAHE